MFRPHKYEGGHRARDLADFVEDILRPVVVPLTVSDNVIAMTWHQLTPIEKVRCLDTFFQH